MSSIHDRAPARKAEIVIPKRSRGRQSVAATTTGTAPRQTHWRQLPPSELADRILQIQRTAVHRHLNVQQWRTLDRMRRRHAALQKEQMS
jgi:hypothetical protein